MQEIKNYCFTLDDDGRLKRADSSFLEISGCTVGQQIKLDGDAALAPEFVGVVEHKLVTSFGEVLECISFVDRLSFRTVITGIPSKKNAAETDLLTGLITRNELVRREKEIVSIGAELSVIFIDVDNFKSVNDSGGHAAGDRLLKQLAEIMKRIFRSGDILCRYGGDEFVILLPGCNIDNAETKAKLLLQLSSAEGISLSVGVASKNAEQQFSEIIANADSAMYRAKSNGKGRTAVYSEM